VAINCHKMQVKEGRGRGRSRAVAAGLRRRARGAEQGKGRGGRRRRWRRQVGPGCQRLNEKEKGRRESGPLREKLSGLLGRKSERGEFFSFPF
jgi:hypothetical protein